MFRFEDNSYFWLLLLIPILIFFYVRLLAWRKRKVQLLGSERMRAKLFTGKIEGRATTKMALLLAALGSMIFGLANLQAGDQSTIVTRNGVDIIFALDVSKSMLAKDIAPNRLSRAKLLVQTVLGNLSQDRAGLVVFAGRAYLQSPITSDFGTVNMLLQAANTSTTPTQGTVLKEALEMSKQAFQSKDKKFKSIILISDGENHDEDAVAYAKELSDEGIIIYTIGIGSPNGAPIFDPELNANKVDGQGNEIISKLNEDVLKAIATAGNGAYLKLNNNNQTAQSLMAALSKMEKKQLGSNIYGQYKSHFQWFIGIAIILLTASLLMPAARKNNQN
jgi:Ca-activated chloride channel family protein